MLAFHSLLYCRSSENGVEKVLSEVFVALVENGERYSQSTIIIFLSQNTSMRPDFIQKIKGLTTTFYKKNDYKNNVVQDMINKKIDSKEWIRYSSPQRESRN